ncbi:hypothetical protein A9Q81_17305, partial [Gammaproteobacteria bacterium 42_54_T18]
MSECVNSEVKDAIKDLGLTPIVHEAICHMAKVSKFTEKFVNTVNFIEENKIKDPGFLGKLSAFLENAKNVVDVSEWTVNTLTWVYATYMREEAIQIFRDSPTPANKNSVLDFDEIALLFTPKLPPDIFSKQISLIFTTIPVNPISIAYAVTSGFYNTLTDVYRDPNSIYWMVHEIERIKGEMISRVSNGIYGDPFFETQFPELSEIEQIRSTTNVLDPLIVDLDGDGFHTSDVDHGVFFDHNADGFSELSSWAEVDDGLLVVDRNADGVINSGRELFGDQTLLESGELATNGYEALAEFDSNNDGLINSEDEKWLDLKIWKDLNRNGVSEVEELLSLEELGLQSISLAAEESGTDDGNGNILVSQSEVVRSDGSSVAMGQFQLDRDVMTTGVTEMLVVSEDVSFLPNMHATGTVYSLHQAIMRDETGELKMLVEEFVSEGAATERKMLMEEILLKWTGADTVESSSRGAFVDAQHLAVIEAFAGRTIEGVDGVNPNDLAGTALEDFYNNFFDNQYAGLMSQTHLKSLLAFSQVSLNNESTKLELDFTLVKTVIEVDFSQEPEITALKALELFEFLTLTQGEGEWKGEIFSDEALMSAIKDISEEGYSLHEDSAETQSVTASIYNDFILGLEGDDNILANNGNDIVFGGVGNDNISVGLFGDNRLYGGEGDDTLEVVSEAISVVQGRPQLDSQNYIQGGVGNDRLIGKASADTYVYNLGDGNDVINDLSTFSIRIIDPLIVDLDKDGLETHAFGQGTLFDHNDDGNLELTGWVKPDDGLLVYDRNNDGVINSGRELFGDQTRLQNGEIAEEGLQALAELDSNLDGMISSLDSQWGKLQVWQDANSNGLTDDGELRDLSDVGITDIQLQSEVVNQSDGEGNVLVKTVSYSDSAGGKGSVGQFSLATSNELLDTLAFGNGISADFLKFSKYDNSLVISINPMLGVNLSNHNIENKISDTSSVDEIASDDIVVNNPFEGEYPTYHESESSQQLVEKLLAYDTDDIVFDPMSVTTEGEGSQFGWVENPYLGVAETGEKIFLNEHAILITSGDGTPPDTNTSEDYSVQTGTGADVTLEEVLLNAEPSPVAVDTFDKAVLEFDFTVTDETATSIELDFIFGSDEFPEYTATQFIDGAAIFVDGVNYAYFGDPSKPLSVNDATFFHSNELEVEDGVESDGSRFSIEYDGVSSRLTLTGLLDNEMAVNNNGKHHIKIVIADTSDRIYDSGLMLADMRLGYGHVGGITQKPIVSDDFIAIEGDVSTDIESAALLENDVDLNNETLTIVEVKDAVGGNVSFAEDGTINFEPEDGFRGQASFHYIVENEQGGRDEGVVSLQVVEAESSIHVENWFLGSEYRIETLAFENGEQISVPEIKQFVLDSMGTEGDDVIVTWNDAVIVNGKGGNDKITTFAFDDVISGGNGDDTLDSGSGDDHLYGDAGNDVIQAGDGNDEVYGGAGNDTL